MSRDVMNDAQGSQFDVCRATVEAVVLSLVCLACSGATIAAHHCVAVHEPVSQP